MWLFRVREGRVARTDELASGGAVVDYDAQGHVMGVRLPGPPATAGPAADRPAELAGTNPGGQQEEKGD